MQKELKRASLCPKSRACDKQERSGTIFVGFVGDAKPPPESQSQSSAVRAAVGRRVEKGEQSPSKSPSALSRFLNLYGWSLWGLVRKVRRWVEGVLLEQSKGKRGPKPRLLAIVDMSCAEKEGNFPALPIHYRNHKRGLHEGVLYLVLAEVKLPWGLRVWQGPGSATPAKLALKLIASLPTWVHRRCRVVVLADGGFGVADFLNGPDQHQYPLKGLTGMRRDRRLEDGRSLHELRRKGQQVHLRGLRFPLGCSWFTVHKPDGSEEKRYLIANFHHSGYTMPKPGALRWAIE